MRKKFILAAVLAALVLTCGCAPRPRGDEGAAGSGAAEGETVRFTDHLGRQLDIPRPERVVAMIGSFADIWLLAGGEDSLVATAHDAWESYELPLGPSVADIGSGMEPSVELVLQARPDLVLASAVSSSNLELRETFERAGTPVAYFEVTSFEDYLALLELFTQLTGRPENYEEYGLAVKDQVDRAVERRVRAGSSPRVLTIQVSGSSVKVKNSQTGVLGPMLKDLGCVNIADREGALLEELSLEVIIQADPDYIFAVHHGTDAQAAQANLEDTLLSNPAWAGLRAVEGERFYVLERRMFNLKPNALWGDAYAQLSDILWGN